MTRSNYHTHTYRCGHAKGADEEYVLAAIAAGYNILGFSDHVMIPDSSEVFRVRGDYKMLPGYLHSIRFLQKKYSSQIEIHLGMEAEYFDELYDFFKSLLTTGQLEYLILGHHYRTFENRYIDGYYGEVTTPELMMEYATSAARALDTGLYSYFAHPDLYMSSYQNWDEHCEQAAIVICEAALRNDVPLEINQGAIRNAGLVKIGDEYRYRYPHIRFWEVVKRMGNKVVVGVDAHDPQDFTNESQNIVQKIVELYNFKPLQVVPFKDPKQLK